MIANTNAIVARHRMSPASVPSLAENVESTLVDMIAMIGLSPSCHSAASAATPFGLHLGAEALMGISLHIKDMEGDFVLWHRCPKNDTLERR
jgi:hypothetical protein